MTDANAESGLIVITTVGEEAQANLLSRELVARRHAACVNVIRGMRSVYRWQGNICQDAEFLLIIKTLAGEYPAVEKTIQELHSYDLPEILAFEVARGEPGFLDWIKSSLDKEADFPDADELPGVDGAE